MTNEETLLNELLSEFKILNKRISSLLVNNEMSEIPSDAESLDIQELCDIAGTDIGNTPVSHRLMTLKAKENETIVITHYAIYTDALNASDVEFIPLLNDNRTLKLHGRPDDALKPKKYSMSVGLCPDLSEQSLRRALITLAPLQTLTWDVFNYSSNARPMGVRVKGYVRSLSKVKENLSR